MISGLCQSKRIKAKMGYFFLSIRICIFLARFIVYCNFYAEYEKKLQ